MLRIYRATAQLLWRVTTVKCVRLSRCRWMRGYEHQLWTWQTLLQPTRWLSVCRRDVPWELPARSTDRVRATHRCFTV